MLSVLKDGKLLRLNKPASELVGTNWKFVHLLFDVEETQVGLKLVRDNDGGAFTLSIQDRGICVYAQDFIKHYGLQPGSYSLHYDEAKRLLTTKVRRKG